MKMRDGHFICHRWRGLFAPGFMRPYISAPEAGRVQAHPAGSPHGQSSSPLLHVKHLMLTPLSALRAPSFCAPALAKYCWLLAAVLGTHFAALHPVSAEELLLGHLPGDQDSPAVLLDETGGYVVFEDNRAGAGKDGRSISAVRLGPDLRAEGESFQVNHLALGKHERPQIVGLGNGKSLALWEVRQGAKAGLYGRVIGANGQFATADFLLNTPSVKSTVKQTVKWTAHYRGKWKTRTHKFKDGINNIREQVGAVSAAALPDGGAVLVYQAIRRSQTNSWMLVDQTYVSRGRFLTNAVLRPTRASEDWMMDVFMQRVDADGGKVGPEILVNQDANYNQRTPSVAVLGNGNIVVVWVCEYAASSDWRANFRVDLIGRIFNPQGEPVGDEFTISAGSAIAQANPVLARNGDGFLVAWSQQDGAVTTGWDVFARSHDAAGNAVGASFRVNAFTAGDQFGPRVASSGDRQMIVWTSVGQDGSREGVYGRQLLAGAFDGDEFRINDQTVSRQLHPALATDGAGRGVVMWSGFTGSTGFDLFSKSLTLGSQ